VGPNHAIALANKRTVAIVTTLAAAVAVASLVSFRWKRLDQAGPAPEINRFAWWGFAAITPAVEEPSLEQSLRNLPSVGTLVKDRKYRQVWRFEHGGGGPASGDGTQASTGGGGKAYYLKFYPKGGPRDLFRRFFRGSPAVYEFTRLQWLQKAGIPAPRAVAAMMGFKLNGQTGDVVILEAIEPSVQLDQVLIEAELRGESVPAHLELAKQIRSIVTQLGQAKLGHEDLHLGNFLLHNGKLFLLDAYAVRSGGMKLRDLLMLAHSARRFCNTTDLLRGWEAFSLGDSKSLPPANNPLTRMLWGRSLYSSTHENRYFGKVTDGQWAGVYFKRTKYAHRWSQASRLEISKQDWLRAWPLLLKQIQDDQLKIIKRSRSGDVLSGEIILAGKPLNVIVKRPRRRYWYRYLNEIGRGSRPYRGWRKAWNLLIRGIPTAWPLLMMEKRSSGYVTDAVLITEQVAGQTLAHENLDAIEENARDLLFRRTGHILRAIEKFGFSHFDAKASNWIVLHDEKLGPMPILVDVDGIRRRQWVALGIQRLLRSMHENDHYMPADSLSLCRGYAPYARFGEIASDGSDHAEFEPKVVES
jgi:tRNA A-37 threonylcarbamoyl transferase component Bud32